MVAFSVQMEALYSIPLVRWANVIKLSRNNIMRTFHKVAGARDQINSSIVKYVFTGNEACMTKVDVVSSNTCAS